MSVYGINIDKTNPTFTIDDFTFWMPQFTNYMTTEEGIKDFNKIYSLVNKKIFSSIFGSDWELAMSYGIAHYLQLRANQLETPSGSTLAEIAGGGTIKGILSSASVGSFSKTYDIDKTVLSNKESSFWNQTSYGASLMSLLATKSLATIFVVSSNNDNVNPNIKFPFKDED